MIFVLIAIVALLGASSCMVIYLVKKRRGQTPNPMHYGLPAGLLTAIGVLAYPDYRLYLLLRYRVVDAPTIILPIVGVLAFIAFTIVVRQLLVIQKARTQLSEPIRARIDPGSVYPSRRGRPPHY